MDPLGKIDNFIRDIDATDDIASIAVALRDHLKVLGFSKYAYQIIKPPTGSRPAFYIQGYPEGWTKRYVEAGHISNDMVSRQAARVIRPFTWLEIGRMTSFTEAQQVVAHEARDFGLAAGGTVPVFGPNNSKALLSVATEDSPEECNKVFLLHRHELQIMATYVFERLLTLKLMEGPAFDVFLSPRELEILTWTARGKTRWEISEILTLSESTVNKYLQSAGKKLNACNKVQAAATALIHGLIIP